MERPDVWKRSGAALTIKKSPAADDCQSRFIAKLALVLEYTGGRKQGSAGSFGNWRGAEVSFAIVTCPILSRRQVIRAVVSVRSAPEDLWVVIVAAVVDSSRSLGLSEFTRWCCVVEDSGMQNQEQLGHLSLSQQKMPASSSKFDCLLLRGGSSFI